MKYNYGEDLYEYEQRAKRDRFWITCRVKSPLDWLREYMEKDGVEDYLFTIIEVTPRMGLCYRVECETENGRVFTFDEDELDITH